MNTFATINTILVDTVLTGANVWIRILFLHEMNKTKSLIDTIASNNGYIGNNVPYSNILTLILINMYI